MVGSSSVPPVNRYVGDDWKGRLAFAFTYQDATGAPIDITGWTPCGQLFVRGGAPIPLTAATGRAALTDPTAGQFELSVEAAVTAGLTPDSPCARTFPTRVQAQIIDPAGNLGTLDLVRILVLDPRTAPP